MKQPRSICLACRFKLLVVHSGPTSRPAWQSAARLSSTSATAVPERTAPRASARDDDRAGTKDIFDHESVKRPRQNWAGRHKNRARKDGGQATGAFDIFKNVVEGHLQDQEALSSPKATSTVTLQLYKDVATLEELLARPSTSTAECFRYFESQLHPHISQARAQVPRVLRNRVGRGLMERVAREKERDFDSKELPSVTHLSQVLLELGLFEPSAFASLVTNLLAHICSISTEPREYTSIESYETAMARRDTLLHDLVGSWKVFNVPPYVAARTGNAAKAAAEARLPQLQKKALMSSSSHRRGKNKAQLSIASLFPHYNPLSLRTTIPAAIATYVLLADPINRTNRMFRADIASFVESMATVLSVNRPNKSGLPELFGQHPTLLQYITERWSAVEIQLEEQSKLQDILGGNEDDQPNLVSQMKRIHRQLGQASNTRNPRALQRTWDEFWGLINTSPDKKEQVLQDNAELFNYFIRAYMGIRQPDRAIEVWNRMVSVGLQPTIKTWNCMIDGCRPAKNLSALKSVWEKLISSGIKLDTAIWTTRISGLIELGDPQAGLLALEEMAKIWKQSQDDDSNNPIAVQPTIEPVNAALAGLLRLDRASAANSLLGWAAKQGIEPDIYTFNTLLGPLVRKGLDHEVQAIFTMMKSQNVEADVATFTILLEGALDGIGEQSPAAQIQILNNFLRAMRDAGVTANMQLYAKIIHLLLQEGDRTGDAVNEVLAIIWGQELELTSHIYTMLADHYFTHDPPKPWAVTALIENRKLHENRDIDRVFWERVISGYCQVNDTARALQSFEKIDRSGGKITFSTLYDLLLVLSRSGEVDAIHKVIEVAKKNIDQHPPGDQGGDAKSRSWKHRFWHLADKYGFLQDDLKTQFQYGNQGGPSF